MSVGGGGPEKQEATAQERALATRAAKDWNDYTTRFTPALKAFRSRLSDKDGAVQTGKADASNLAAKAFGGGDTALVAKGLRQGAAPSSGRTVLGLADKADGFATTAGRGSYAAETAADDRELRGLIKLAAHGRGLADENSMALTRIGNQQTAADAENLSRKMSRDQFLSRSVGQGLGAAASGLNLKGLWKES